MKQYFWPLVLAFLEFAVLASIVSAVLVWAWRVF